jgi:hypothetical protein
VSETAYIHITLSIHHARQCAGHELQTTLSALRRIHLSDVIDMEETTGHRYDKRVVNKVHLINTLWNAVRRLLWGRCAGIPETHSAVPRATDNSIYVYNKSIAFMNREEQTH